VESQTNGLLSSNLAGLHDHLDAQTVEIMADGVSVPGRFTPGQERLARAVGGQAASDAQVRGPIRPSTTRP
jgi:hypothetical protein